MPIPVIPNHWQVVTVWKANATVDAKSWSCGLYFENEGSLTDPEDIADSLSLIMNDFWGDVNPPGGTRITAFLSSMIDVSASVYKIYDLGSAAPRTPYSRAISAGAVASTSALPNEVSLVLSYRSGPGTAQGGTIDKTRRGRIYVGPLAITAGQVSSVEEDSRPTDNLRGALLGGGEYLLGTLLDDMVWKQYSRTLNRMENVTGGYCDNAWDTQRRRGMPSSDRDTFG